MAERLARVEQSLLEIHASMKDFMAASIETWTRNSSWGSEDCVWFCVLLDEVFSCNSGRTDGAGIHIDQ